MKSNSMLFFITIIITGHIAPLSLDTLIDSDRKTVLLNQGTVTEVQLKTPRPLLIPRHRVIRTLVDFSMEELNPSLFVENLHLYKKPSSASLPVWSEAERQALFNHALALSTLAGIRYYSTSRKTMRTFYELSTVIDGPDTKRPLPDPIAGQSPETVVLYARQKDLTFGDNIYRYTYHDLSDGLAFVQQNCTPLNAGIIPAVGKDKLRSVIAVIDAEAYLLIYMASMAKAASIPGINQRIGESFSTRADAIVRWFTGQADKAFAALTP